MKSKQDPYKQPVEENWILLRQCILDTIDDLVPTKCIKNHQNLPWVSKNIRHKLKKKRSCMIFDWKPKSMDTAKTDQE